MKIFNSDTHTHTHTKRYHKILFIVSIYYSFAFLFRFIFMIANENKELDSRKRERAQESGRLNEGYEIATRPTKIRLDLFHFWCVRVVDGVLGVLELWWWVQIFMASINDCNYYESRFDHLLCVSFGKTMPNECLACICSSLAHQMIPTRIFFTLKNCLEI